MNGIYAPMMADNVEGVIKTMLVATDDYEKTVNKARWNAENRWKYDSYHNEYPYVVSVIVRPGESCALTGRIVKHAVVVAKVRIFESERKRLEFMEKQQDIEKHLTGKKDDKGKD